MRVTIKLKSERRPSWYTQITEPEIFVDIIEIIVKAPARIIFEKCFMALFVMPWFISCAGLHCRKNMNDSRMISSFRNYFFYPKPNPKDLEDLFRYEVFKMLKSEGKINDLVIENMMNLRHSGFKSQLVLSAIYIDN